MKTLARTMVLVLLLAVTCSATFIAVLAAEDFTGDQEMASYGTPQARLNPGDDLPGTRISGTRVSDIENAPALQINTEVIIPPMATPTADAPDTQSPNTGVESHWPQYGMALALLGGALAVYKRKESELV